LDAVDSLEECLRDPAGDESSRAAVLAQLVDGQNAVANEFGLGAGEVGEDETRAIAEDNPITQVDGLEMFRLAGS
jgi:hypothetical protein